MERASRADLYHSLAEALSAPPDWLALPGKEWPLQIAAEEIAGESPAAHRALSSAIALVGSVQASSSGGLEERYAWVFNPQDCAGVWLNETGAINGRLIGAETWEVAQWYRTAGLEIPGTELPDSASVELEFLAHLAACEQTEARLVEQAFLKQHAGRWLPQLGRMLAQSGDPIYAPVGQMLQSWLVFVQRHPQESTPVSFRQTPQADPDCTLCMACLAACPREALRVQETAQFTRLVLSAADCDGCGVCLTACAPGALAMGGAMEQPGQGWQVLFESPREICTQCGAPYASQAELHYVASVLGHRNWLSVCPDCR